MDMRDVLNQIAIDVAVIKNDLENIKSLNRTVSKNTNDITKISTQLTMTKWFLGILGSGVVGICIKLFT